MKTLLTIIVVMGIICLVVGELASVGYFLWLWGHLGEPLGQSAWNAFVFFVEASFVGFLIAVVPFFLKDK